MPAGMVAREHPGTVVLGNNRLVVGLDEKVTAVAAVLVSSGRVVPGLDHDRASGVHRSWWWPLPTASQRSLIASLLEDPSPEGQAEVAAALAVEVDGLVRRQLVEAGATIVPRRGGRPTVPEAWARSLVSTDPFLPGWLDRAKLEALAASVADWVRSGAVVGGRARLCLRVHEPVRAGREWSVELLAQDREEPSLVVPLREVWAWAVTSRRWSGRPVLSSRTPRCPPRSSVGWPSPAVWHQCTGRPQTSTW